MKRRTFTKLTGAGLAVGLVGIAGKALVEPNGWWFKRAEDWPLRWTVTERSGVEANTGVRLPAEAVDRFMAAPVTEIVLADAFFVPLVPTYEPCLPDTWEGELRLYEAGTGAALAVPWVSMRGRAERHGDSLHMQVESRERGVIRPITLWAETVDVYAWDLDGGGKRISLDTHRGFHLETQVWDELGALTSGQTFQIDGPGRWPEPASPTWGQVTLHGWCENGLHRTESFFGDIEVSDRWLKVTVA